MLFCWDAVVETKKVLDAVKYIMFVFLLLTVQDGLQRMHKYFLFYLHMRKRMWISDTSPPFEVGV